MSVSDPRFEIAIAQYTQLTSAEKLSFLIDLGSSFSAPFLIKDSHSYIPWHNYAIGTLDQNKLLEDMKRMDANIFARARISDLLNYIFICISDADFLLNRQRLDKPGQCQMSEMWIKAIFLEFTTLDILRKGDLISLPDHNKIFDDCLAKAVEYSGR